MLSGNRSSQLRFPLFSFFYNCKLNRDMQIMQQKMRSKYIFLLISVCLLVLTICSAVLAGQERKKHGEYYALYKETDRLFEAMDYSGAWKGYEELIVLYPESHILELKLALCALNLEDIPEALDRAKRALALNPVLAADDEFIGLLTHCYIDMEDTENLKIIQDYDARYTAE